MRPKEKFVYLSMEQIIKRISSKVPIDDALKEAIRECFVLEKIPKNYQLLKDGQIAQKLYFLKRGTIRTFYDNDGREVTYWFYVDEQFFTSWHSFHDQNASFEYIEALEDSEVYSITHRKYHELINTFPMYERFARLLSQELLSFLDYFYKGFYFMTAKEKYELLLSYYPDIEQKVKLGYIASFLGITQETLSRIRSAK